MTELVFKIDDNLAARFSKVAKENYNGDQNAALSDALLLPFSSPKRRIPAIKNVSWVQLKEKSKSPTTLTRQWK